MRIEPLRAPLFPRILGVLALVVSLSATFAMAGCSDDPAPATAADTDQDSGADAGANGDDDAAISPDAEAQDAAPACKLAKDCPQGDVVCELTQCIGGECGFVQAPNGWGCDDGDACTEKEACASGFCEGGKPKGCDDDEVCTSDVCDGSSGKCSNTATGGTCDDGNPCTTGDTCAEGECSAGDNVCACQETKDCVSKEDGDACNGTLFCDKSEVPYTCEVNAATTVTCDQSGGKPCAPIACDPKDGSCKTAAKPDKSPCDDGEKCSLGDVCAAGKCEPGTWTCQCTNDAECVNSDDGDKCNGTAFCDKSSGLCKTNPATVVTCPAALNNACVKHLCGKLTGACAPVPEPELTPCDDANSCTTGDACQSGKCAASAAANTCLCKKDQDCAPHEDGNLCNGTLFCSLSTGKCEVVPASIKSCPTVDDSACQAAACVPKTGACTLSNAATGTVCDDGDSCTVGETCGNGLCLPQTAQNTCDCKADVDCTGDAVNKCLGPRFCNLATNKCEFNPAGRVICSKIGDTECAHNWCEPVSGACEVTPVHQGHACDDANATTEGDFCDAGACKGTQTKQCAVSSDCTKLADGTDKCNGTLYCDKAKGACEVNPGSVVLCNTKDNTDCMAAKCEPTTGQCKLQAVHLFGACDDGNPCTGGSTCADSGKCTGGTDLCACHVDPDCAAKDDGNLCNGVMFCDTSVKPWFACKPKPNTTVKCPTNQDTVCQSSVCEPATGACEVKPIPEMATKTCDDKDACTAETVCQNGVCSGVLKVCDDANDCTKDGCDVNSGCIALPQSGTQCSDDNACNGDDACDKGSCVGKKVDCDDKNVCTADSCDPKEGCVNATLSGGKCDDGDACTTSDVCVVGTCQKGGVLTCDDKLTCTTDACDQKTGCVYVKISDKACDDGDKCTVSDTCLNGACDGTAKDCDDNNVCTTDSCPATGQCSNVFNALPCQDGDKCLLWVCESGKCRDAPGTIVTVAGTSAFGSLDGDATDAQLSSVWGVALGPDGTLYMTERDASRIRKRTPAGKLVGIAGNGKGFANGPAATAKFNDPIAVTWLPGDNLAVADPGNYLVRHISKAGAVTTLAGSKWGYKDGKGAEARFTYVYSVLPDKNNLLWVVDRKNHVIRTVTLDGVVGTAAGTGESAGTKDGSALSAQFDNPYGIAHGNDGDVYIGDDGNSTLRRLHNGIVTTVAGTVGVQGYANGAAKSALFDGLRGLAVAPTGHVYISDSGNGAIRRLSPLGVVETVAGHPPVSLLGAINATSGDRDGSVLDALIDTPGGLVFAPNGTLYIGDYDNHVVRALLPSGRAKCDDGNACTADSCDATTGKCSYTHNVGSCESLDGACRIQSCIAGTCKEDGATLVTIAGTGQSGQRDGDAHVAFLKAPDGVAVDTKGNVFFAEMENRWIWKINLNGFVTTYAGGGSADWADGVGTAASMDDPEDITYHPGSDSVWIVDTDNHRIRKIDNNRKVTTIAGSGSTSSSKGGFVDGAGNVAKFNRPDGISWDAFGDSFVVSDSHNCRVRRVTLTGKSSTIAGAVCGFLDGSGTSARFDIIEKAVADSKGRIYVADGKNHAIRRIATNGMVITVAGAGKAGFADGVAANALVNDVDGFAVLPDDSVLFADEQNHRIRRLIPNHSDLKKSTITTVHGSIRGWRNGGATALLYNPSGMYSVGEHVWLTDDANHRIFWRQPAAGGCAPGKTCSKGLCTPK